MKALRLPAPAQCDSHRLPPSERREAAARRLAGAVLGATLFAVAVAPAEGVGPAVAEAGVTRSAVIARETIAGDPASTAARLTGAAGAASPGPNPGGAAAQGGANGAPPPDGAVGSLLTFSAYLAEVGAANLDLAVARYNEPIARAQAAIARVFPNPTLSAGTAGRDVSDSGSQREPANNELSVAETIELGGKRRRRMAVAAANLAQAAATLEDFLRTLRGNAATAFVDALTKRRIADEKLRSAGSLDQLVDANSKLFEVGNIGEMDLTQSRVDALQQHADHLAAESDALVAAIALEQWLGRRAAAAATATAGGAAAAATDGKTLAADSRIQSVNGETRAIGDRRQPAAGPVIDGTAQVAFGAPMATGDLAGPARHFDAGTLAAGAVERRPDVAAARHALDSARANVTVAQAMAVPDLSVAFTYQQNERSTNDIAPAPAFNSVGLSVSLPLPLFNRYRGELESARQTMAQAEATLRGVELRATVDVRQALARYQLADRRAAQFQGGALDDAAAVFQAKVFSYQHGAATLLDVLNAQRAESDVRLAYLNALDERAKALIALEQAAGIWDVDF